MLIFLKVYEREAPPYLSQMGEVQKSKYLPSLQEIGWGETSLLTNYSVPLSFNIPDSQPNSGSQLFVPDQSENNNSFPGK